MVIGYYCSIERARLEVAFPRRAARFPRHRGEHETVRKTNDDELGYIHDAAGVDLQTGTCRHDRGEAAAAFSERCTPANRG